MTAREALDRARALVQRGDPAAGLQALAARRQAAAEGDASLAREAQAVLARLVPRYHAQVVTDPVRIAAWDSALRSVIRPGMTALEIGTGCGILAMLAARAGAQVTACERDPVIAEIARETLALNSLSDAVRIISKPAEALAIPEDLPAPADLLFLDLFADNLFGFRPFQVIREARRLLAPGARIVPARASLVGALAHWPDWRRMVPAEMAGFDITPLQAVAPLITSLESAPLLSEPETLFTADLNADLPTETGMAEHTLTSTGGPTTGILTWLRLDLTEAHALEAHPNTNLYARPQFHPFGEERELAAGEQVPVTLSWRGQRMWVLPG